MRALAGLGLLVFAYLTLIPAGLVAATLDPSCGNFGCDQSAAAAVALVALYCLCAIALAATALRFGAYALRPGPAAGRRIATTLGASAAAVGIVLFGLFAISFPIAGATIAALGAGLYLWLRRRPAPADPQTNGHRRRIG